MRKGHHVSVMAIKAIGTVRDNLGNRRTLRVDWQSLHPPREWYFYTNRGTVWKASPGDWKSEVLIRFTFGEEKHNV